MRPRTTDGDPKAVGADSQAVHIGGSFPRRFQREGFEVVVRRVEPDACEPLAKTQPWSI